jgi:hypothetical protein
MWKAECGMKHGETVKKGDGRWKREEGRERRRKMDDGRGTMNEKRKGKSEP